MTAYQKRVKERDEAMLEILELKRLIHDFITDQSRHSEMLAITLEVDLYDTMEKIIWMGDK